MNTTLKTLLADYGTESVIARLLEQLKLAVLSDDKEVRAAVKDLLESSACDTEYIYSLCEYTNLVTYAGETQEVTDGPWNDPDAKAGLRWMNSVK